MICLRCNSEEFVLKSNAEVEQVFRGEAFKVISPVMACKVCGWQTLGPGQLNELGLKAADAYRKTHGLLTAAEIKAWRAQLGLSQREFAGRLGVGEASVKRWETWLVQEKSSDALMRLKVAEIRAEQGSQRALSGWLVGDCATGTAVIKHGGIQLRPPQKETQPLWDLASAHAQPHRSSNPMADYDTTFPVTA